MSYLLSIILVCALCISACAELTNFESFFKTFEEQQVSELTGVNPPNKQPDEQEFFVFPPNPSYWKSSSCRGCHYKIFEQHAESMHEKSFKNPVFRSQYFKELLPLLDKDSSIIKDARACIACHVPVAYMINRGHVVSENQVNDDISGVACDFCHTITGFVGNTPADGKYISSPGDIKYGPTLSASNKHHSKYSPLFRGSEFCAICHNSTNHNGIEVKSTFTEWKESIYAKKNIQCQDCHMNAKGYLTDGKPVYESGSAAYINIVGYGMVTRQREKLFTHRFPGAHHKTQLDAAISLNIEIERLGDNEINVNVLVDNSVTGHKMPTGSTELRLLWLEVKARAGDMIIPLTAISENEPAFDVTGKSPFDKEIIRDDIPDGVRIYRTVFIDKNGKQTMSSYMASKIVFDNRLKPAEIRKETYRLKIPEGVKGKLTFSADLNYLAYPSSFAKRLGVPRTETVKIYSAKKEIELR